MKEDEIKFFRLCYQYITHIQDKVYQGKYSPRDLINIIDEWLPHKKAWYYLEKWSKLNFYDYGVTLDLGWIEDEKIPQRYKELIKENLNCYDI